MFAEGDVHFDRVAVPQSVRPFVLLESRGGGLLASWQVVGGRSAPTGSRPS